MRMRQHGIRLIVGQLVEQRKEDQNRIEIIRTVDQLVNSGLALQDGLFGERDPVLSVLQHLLDRHELFPVDQPAALEQLRRKLDRHLVDFRSRGQVAVHPRMFQIAAGNEHHLPVADVGHMIADDAPRAACPDDIVELAFAVDVDRKIEIALPALEHDEAVLLRNGRHLRKNIVICHSLQFFGFSFQQAAVRCAASVPDTSGCCDRGISRTRPCRRRG